MVGDARSSLLRLLVDDHVALVELLQEHRVHLALALGLVARDRRSKRLREHRGLRHRLGVAVVLPLLHFILLEGALERDLLARLVRLDPLGAGLEEVDGLAALLCNKWKG